MPLDLIRNSNRFYELSGMKPSASLYMDSSYGASLADNIMSTMDNSFIGGSFDQLKSHANEEESIPNFHSGTSYLDIHMPSKVTADEDNSSMGTFFVTFDYNAFVPGQGNELFSLAFSLSINGETIESLSHTMLDDPSKKYLGNSGTVMFYGDDVPLNYGSLNTGTMVISIAPEDTLTTKFVADASMYFWR